MDEKIEMQSHGERGGLRGDIMDGYFILIIFIDPF
jgi:hypothetical protein